MVIETRSKGQHSYQLNKSKALQKKKLATNRRPLTMTENPRARLYNLEFSAGLFEVLKEALFSYNDDEAEQGRVNHVKENEDENGAITDLSIFFNGFTVNVYNTQSKLTVNGPNYKAFLRVLQEVQARTNHDQASQLNHMLQQQLSSAIEPYGKTRNQPAVIHSPPKALCKSPLKATQSPKELIKAIKEASPTPAESTAEALLAIENAGSTDDLVATGGAINLDTDDEDPTEDVNASGNCT